MQAPRAEPRPNPEHELARDGLVRICEYRCTASVDEAPEAEEFARTSIAIVRSGVFGVRCEQRTQLLTTGFLLVGNRGQQYEISHEHGGGDCCLDFQFAEAAIEELAGLLRRHSAGRPFARSVVPPLPQVEALRHLAEERLFFSDAHAVGLEEIAFALAACVLREAGTGSSRPAPMVRSNRRTRDRVYAAVDFLERSAAEEIHLADVADSVGLSAFHLLRIFKREIGVTPYRFLMQARIRRAVDLLRDTSRSVTEIAYDVGFGDLSNFINTFRREVGSSPRQFRTAGLAIDDWRAHSRPRAAGYGATKDQRTRATPA